MNVKLKLNRLKATAAARNTASRTYRSSLQLAHSNPDNTLYDGYNTVPTIQQRHSRHSPDILRIRAQSPPESRLQPGIGASVVEYVPTDTGISAVAETTP